MLENYNKYFNLSKRKHNLKYDEKTILLLELLLLSFISIKIAILNKEKQNNMPFLLKNKYF